MQPRPHTVPFSENASSSVVQSLEKRHSRWLSVPVHTASQRGTAAVSDVPQATAFVWHADAQSVSGGSSPLATAASTGDGSTGPPSSEDEPTTLVPPSADPEGPSAAATMTSSPVPESAGPFEIV